MNNYEEKLKQFIEDKGINAEHLIFERSTHSVADASAAAGASAEDIVKSICMIDKQGNLIVAIVKGEDRASTSRVEKALNIDRPRMAKPHEILEKSGYPVGGVPSLGYHAAFLIDPSVMIKETVFSGGGSERSLVRIAPTELLEGNNGIVVRIRK